MGFCHRVGGCAVVGGHPVGDVVGARPESRGLRGEVVEVRTVYLLFGNILALAASGETKHLVTLCAAEPHYRVAQCDPAPGGVRRTRHADVDQRIAPGRGDVVERTVLKLDLVGAVGRIGHIDQTAGAVGEGRMAHDDLFELADAARCRTVDDVLCLPRVGENNGVDHFVLVQHLFGGRALRGVEKRRSAGCTGVEVYDAVVDAEQRDVVIASRLHQVGRAFDAQVAQYDLLQCPFGLEVFGYGDRCACRIVRVEFQIACDGDSCVRRYRVFARYEIDGLVLTVGALMIAARSSPGRTTITSCPGASGRREFRRGDRLAVSGFQCGGVFRAGRECCHGRRTCGDVGRGDGNLPLGVSTPLRVSTISESSSARRSRVPADFGRGAYGVGREVELQPRRRAPERVRERCGACTCRASFCRRRVPACIPCR